MLWPMPMYASKYIFSKQFFTGWVTVGIIWIFGSFGAVVIYPAWESRRTVLNVLRLLFTGKKPGHVEQGAATPTGVMDSPSGTATPIKGEVSSTDAEKV